MKFQLEIADRVRTVEILADVAAKGPPPTGASSAGGTRPRTYQVLVDGQRRLVEAVRMGADAWSLIVRDEHGSSPRSVDAVVMRHSAGSANDQANGTLDVHIDGFRIPVQVRNGAGRRTRSAGASAGNGPQRVTAPMPGRVVRVLVEAGDPVKARQGLVVVEAMKMENELRAARDGRVRDVLVREGQSVEPGTVLVVVE